MIQKFVSSCVIESMILGLQSRREKILANFMSKITLLFRERHIFLNVLFKGMLNVEETLRRIMPVKNNSA